MVSYDIDGAGRRVGRHKTGGTWRGYLLGEGNRVVAEYNQSGTIVSQFVYATRSHVPDFMIQGNNVYRFVTDQLGSVRLVMNVNASTVGSPISGSWAPDWHRDRNSLQVCPPVVSGCRDNSSYDLDPRGAHDHETYRGIAPST